METKRKGGGEGGPRFSEKAGGGNLPRRTLCISCYKVTLSDGNIKKFHRNPTEISGQTLAAWVLNETKYSLKE